MNPLVQASQKSLSSGHEEHEWLQKATTRFPDLDKHVNRWKRERFVSKEATPLCVKWEQTHNCGCCNDSPLEIWPYMEFEGKRIYSNPTGFMVANKYYWYEGSGYEPYDKWADRLKSANVPDQVINEVAQFLEANPPSWRSEED